MATINGNSIYNLLQTIASLSSFTHKVIEPSNFTKVTSLFKSLDSEKLEKFESVVRVTMKMDSQSFKQAANDFGLAVTGKVFTHSIEFMNKLFILELINDGRRPAKDPFQPLPWK